MLHFEYSSYLLAYQLHLFFLFTVSTFDQPCTSLINYKHTKFETSYMAVV